jgi:hypothetical protein
MAKEASAMFLEVNLTDAIGKTLAAVEFSMGFGGSGDQVVLAFSDGTFATLGIDRDQPVGDEEIKEDTLDVFRFNQKALVRAGIVTKEELSSMRAEQDRLAKAAQESYDRRQFEYLKKKFGHES